MTKTYSIRNLDCANCALKIQNHLNAVSNAHNASINFSTLTLSIDALDIDAVQKEIKRIEPQVEIVSLELTDSSGAKPAMAINIVSEVSIIAVAAILTAAGFFAHKYFNHTPYHFLEYIAIFIAYGLSGRQVLVKAFRTAFFGRMFDENILMAIATLGAMAIHDLPEAASVMVFFKIGDLLQRLALNHSRKSISALLSLRPSFALVQASDNSLTSVKPGDVKIGQIILVKAGERIPLDGKIVCGHADIDSSALTGEHAPRSVGVSDEVLAGTINLNGELCIKVDKEFSQSSFSKIMQLTESALAKKAKTEQIITKFARFYTPAVVIAAVLVSIVPMLFIPGAHFANWFHRALVLLVISCPCAFVISIPLGYFGGIGAASKKGILLKSSGVFDNLAGLRTVVFDKTGTLTKGVFEVTAIMPESGFTSESLLEFAALIQAHSLHPIARSIVRHYGKHIDTSRMSHYNEIAGFGVKALIRGKRIMVGNDRLMHRENIAHSICSHDSTVVHVAVDERYAGFITIGDAVKPEAREAIKELRKCNIEAIHLVTGDNLAAAKAIADQLDIDEVHAELLPQGKLQIVEKLLLLNSGRKKLAFVGDGINDAPVIARADIGIAMGDVGSDAAIETSDMVIMSGSLLKLAQAVRIARKTRVIVWQNIILAFAAKGFFITLGIMGIATMWEAVFADMGVALCAIFNATRILNGKD
jgi:Cd2+/Zn2+-exporting ATPase